jgi:acetyl esterase/lipase
MKMMLKQIILLAASLPLAAASAALYSDSGDYVPSTPPSSSINLWPGLAPGEHPGAIGPEYAMCFTADTPVSKCKDLGVGNVTVPTLTPYLVPHADSAVVVAPGGGYSVLAMVNEGEDIATWLNSIGVSAFVLKYRVPGRPWLPFGGAPLMDAQRAMGLVREMAGGGPGGGGGKLPSLNASKVGFMGFSAGGHLAGHINVAWRTRAYPLVDKVDAKPCRPDASIMVYPWRSVSQAPVHEPASGASADNVTRDTPPTMLVQAEDDPVHVENALFYWLALKQQGAAPSELHLYPRGGHGYGRCTVKPTNGDEVCTWPDRGARFLQTLGMAPPARD